MKKFFFALIAVIALLAVIGGAVWGGLLTESSGEPVVTPSPTATPEAQPVSGIDAKEAENIALALFPNVTVDRTNVQITDYGDGPFYECEIRTQDEKKIQVWIDQATGDLLGFFAGSQMMGRPAEPVLSMDEARKIARAYVDEKSGGANLTLTSESYHTFSGGSGGTVADGYSFRYNRLIRGVPCISDGFSISVDAVTGDVRRYSKQWKTDEDLCTADTVPSVSEESAKDAARTYLKETWGDLPGLAVHTADLRWYDGKTGSTDAVPLVWVVRFDDDHYRSLEFPDNATAYVDAHTGEIAYCSYNPNAT